MLESVTLDEIRWYELEKLICKELNYYDWNYVFNRLVKKYGKKDHKLNLNDERYNKIVDDIINRIVECFMVNKKLLNYYIKHSYDSTEKIIHLWKQRHFKKLVSQVIEEDYLENT